ncbi:unnamed protein product [Adineta ricciae]|uniref:Uncharacterized protein n=1 Tax=Adineta ricciae TaxID=249248 RepID=A0A815IMP2_ADIRI|nr:unnamed protein product [Adineta ricciae]
MRLSYKENVRQLQEIDKFEEEYCAKDVIASLNREQTLGFIVGGIVNSSQLLVFFVVDTDISPINTGPFADITSASNIANKHEISYAPDTLSYVKSRRFNELDDT